MDGSRLQLRVDDGGIYPDEAVLLLGKYRYLPGREHASPVGDVRRRHTLRPDSPTLPQQRLPGADAPAATLVVAHE